MYNITECFLRSSIYRHENKNKKDLVKRIKELTNKGKHIEAYFVDQVLNNIKPLKPEEVKKCVNL